MRRKLTGLICAVIIVFSFIACRNDGSTSSISQDQQYAGGMAEKAVYTEPVE